MVSERCPKCGSQNIVGYQGEYDCFNCGHKFSANSPSVASHQTIMYFAKPGRGSFLLGVIGGVFGILIGIGLLLFGSLVASFGIIELQQVYVLVAFETLGGVLGILAASIGRKTGGIILLVASFMTLIGAGLFGILPFILLLLGGIFAFREVRATTTPIQKHALTTGKGKRKWILFGVGIFLLVLILSAATNQAGRTKSEDGLGPAGDNRKTTGITTQTTAFAQVKANCVGFLGSRYEVSVVDFIRGEKASKEVFVWGGVEKGFELVLVKVGFTYLAGQGLMSIFPTSFKAYVDGVGYSPELFIRLPYDKPRFQYVDLIPGGKTEGWIVFKVPQNREMKIAYEELGRLCFVASLPSS